MGDTNFTNSMEKRGGRTVAFTCDALWRALVQVLSAAEMAGVKKPATKKPVTTKKPVATKKAPLKSPRPRRSCEAKDRCEEIEPEEGQTLDKCPERSTPTALSQWSCKGNNLSRGGRAMRVVREGTRAGNLSATSSVALG